VKTRICAEVFRAGLIRMPHRLQFLPSYRLHKQSGQAVVTLPDGQGGRHDVLLGPYATQASRLRYARVIEEWEAAGRRFPFSGGHAELTINELILAFWRYAEGYYRHPDGSLTSELAEYRYSLKPLRAMYGHSRACQFGPLALKAVRQQMVEAGLCRGLINRRVGRIRRVFKWAVAEELVPASTLPSLQAVAGLARGRSEARESSPVQPVPEEVARAVLPHVLPPVTAMIELQLLTGARPGEVCAMRACDLDVTGEVWLYRPPRHKTSWRGKQRVVPLGPRAQAIIKRFLVPDVGAYLFSPARAMAERSASLRAARKTKVQPSQVNRRKTRPKRRPGDRYTTQSYGRAVYAACKKAGVARWHPNQLRHTRATEIRRQFGLEGAQVMLGHSRADVTQIYADADLSLALKIAKDVG
jgi:integrase